MIRKRFSSLLLAFVLCFSFAARAIDVSAADPEAEIDGTFFDYLTTAINAVPASASSPTTIKLLKDVTGKFTIDNKRNIVLDLQNHTLSNDDTVIENTGKSKLEIKNGTMTSSGTNGMINNKGGSELTINSGRYIATYTKQVIYNDGATLNISGNAYLESAASERATVHNRGSGKATIAGGKIVSKNYYAVYNESGTLIIGTKDGACDAASPEIRGKTYAVIAKDSYKFYDGLLGGGTYHVGATTNNNNPPGVKNDVGETKIAEMEEDSIKKTGSDEDEGVSYQTFYCEINASSARVSFDANGGEVSPNYKRVSIGDAIGELPEPTRFDYHFDGWFTDPEGGDQINESTVVTSDITYYAHWTYVEPTYVAWIDGVGYRTLHDATVAAKSGDTIVLGEGEYSLYDTSSSVRKNKVLTFVGQGPDKTKWYVGAKVPAAGESVSEYKSDYSLKDAGKITFKNMTLQNGTADYLGFTHLNDVEFDGCVINGKMEYVGYNSTVYKNSTLNCPNNDYCLWTYTSPNLTFEGNTFNSSGKTINVYSNASNIESRNIVINFSGNTVNSSNAFSNRAVMNINDTDRVSHDNYFIINFGDGNTINGIEYSSLNQFKPTKDITCSRYFEFTSGGNNGRTIVNMLGKNVWRDGEVADFVKIIDYDIHPDYTTTITDWELDDSEEFYKRSRTDECTYCRRIFTKQENGYWVTYTDGVDDEDIFEDQISEIILEGEATPKFLGGTPVRAGYTFTGWDKAVSPTVTETVVYTARWDKIVPPPKTNDDILFYVALYGMAIAGLVGSTIIKKK